jgi:hypothetical protein
MAITNKYSKSSPYYNTKKYGNFLDVLTPRTVPPQADDVSYTISRVYQYRPDMLAYDLYKNASLWWVFAVRNPNVLKNPINDFKAGVTILIPKKTTITQALGL